MSEKHDNREQLKSQVKSILLKGLEAAVYGALATLGSIAVTSTISKGVKSSSNLVPLNSRTGTRG